MTKRTTAKRRKPSPLLPSYFECLGRTVPATQEGRIRLANGPLVLPETLATLEVWQSVGRLTHGQLVDQLAQHATATGFQPIRKKST